MTPTFYLKKKSAVELNGHQYSASCFNIGTLAKLNLDTPSRKTTMIKQMGNGVIIRETPFYEDRKIQASIKFQKNSGFTFSQWRDQFYSNWVTTDEEIYLYRKCYNRVDRLKIKIITTAGETWDSYNISDAIKISMLPEDPFFYSIEPKTYQFEKEINSDLFTCQLINTGTIATPFTIKVTVSQPIPFLIIFLYENIGIEITEYINANTTIEINTKNMTTKLNNIETVLETNGSPFQLQPGNNSLKIRCNSNAIIDITFHERYL